MNTSNKNFEIGVIRRAKQWGWEDAPETVLASAQTSLRWSNLSISQILEETGAMSSADAESLLNDRPESIKPLDWLSKSAEGARVRPVADRILALKNEIAFYENLSFLTEHPGMQDVGVAKHCNELDAALMMIEMKTPVLVFSQWDTLFSFMVAGQESRLRDPIRLILGDKELKLACSRREEIGVVLGIASMGNASAATGDSDAIWQGNTSELPEQKELARLIEQALAQSATDIAFKPFRDGTMQVLFRRYGDLVSPIGNGRERRLDAELASNAVMFLSQRSGANPTSTRMMSPCDGQITYRSSSGEVFLRLSFLPLLHPGERRDLISVSMRLLPRVEQSVSVDELKISPAVREELDLAMRMGRGFILIAGPTNSGKSTTIAGAIGLHVDRHGDTRKRISVEEPIERFVFGMTQVNVRQRGGRQNNESEDRFSPILRAIKRHDPDVIVVGEIRDEHTANLSVTASTSGHLVLSSIHANDCIMAADVLARMVSASMSFQLMESLSLILSQRLIKTLCPECRVKHSTNDNDRKVWRHYCEMIGDDAELPSEIYVANPEGCSAKGCSEGYSGIAPIHEVLPFTRTAKTLAAKLLTDPQARSELSRMRTVRMSDEALRMLASGRADLDSVLV